MAILQNFGITFLVSLLLVWAAVNRDRGQTAPGATGCRRRAAPDRDPSVRPAPLDRDPSARPAPPYRFTRDNTYVPFRPFEGEVAPLVSD